MSAVTGSSAYRVLDRGAPRRAADPLVAQIAARLQQTLTATSPHGATGRLAGSWEVVHGRAPAVYIVQNLTPYGRYVEYGTRHMPARPMIGRALAQARAQVGR